MGNFGNPSKTVSIGTWNLFMPTDVEHSRPVLEKAIRRGVTKLYMNEAQGKHRTQMLHDVGFETWAYEQWRMAWNPQFHKLLAANVLQVPGVYYTQDGKQKETFIVGVLTADTWGRTSEDWSVHTPAAVQPLPHPDRRVDVFVNALELLTDLAEQSDADAWCAGGDFNWDIDDGPTLQVISNLLISNPILRALPPESDVPTLGPTRAIDYFLKRRVTAGDKMVPVRASSWVMPGGGTETPSHRFHGRTLRWL